MAVSFPSSFNRLNRAPLDVTDVFATFTDLEMYLSNGPAYAGQIVAVRSSVSNTPIPYIVNEDFTVTQIPEYPVIWDDALQRHRLYNPVTMGLVNIPVEREDTIDPRDVITYGVRVDYTNPNPYHSVSYTNDAVTMVGGSNMWDTAPIFRDIRPCMLQNGAVMYYLNPNNFEQRADGTPADLSGADGDVMIEFPKMGLRIDTTGDFLTVQVTNNPDATWARYWAFTGGGVEGDRNRLYLAAYQGSLIDGQLRSVSGVVPPEPSNFTNQRVTALARGAGYSLLGFYQWTLIQALFLIRYKNLNSQQALGNGVTFDAVVNQTRMMNGTMNQQGMYYANPVTPFEIKCFGIEHLWGHLARALDGIITTPERRLLIGTHNFNNIGAGYTDFGHTTDHIGDDAWNQVGFMTRVRGNNETAFFPAAIGGSSTTFFSDRVSFGSDASFFFRVGGTNTMRYEAGIFQFWTWAGGSTNSTIPTLMFLA